VGSAAINVYDAPLDSYSSSISYSPSRSYVEPSGYFPARTSSPSLLSDLSGRLASTGGNGLVLPPPEDHPHEHGLGGHAHGPSPGPRIIDNGSRIIDSGSRIIDSGSRIINDGGPIGDLQADGTVRINLDENGEPERPSVVVNMTDFVKRIDVVDDLTRD